MNLPTIEMEKEQAEQALAEYRQAVTSGSHEKMNEARRDYEKMDRAIMRGYREIAKGNSLIRLSEVIAAGGTLEVEWDASYWDTKKGTVKRTGHGVLPRMAVTRADARICHCSGISADGSVTFWADDRWSRRQADRMGFNQAFGTSTQIRGSHGYQAIVPMIPPPLRPQHKLSNYHLLWEAEWQESPRTAPGDPALLRHLEGDLYAVLALWDLTELERAVLSGMRGE